MMSLEDSIDDRYDEKRLFLVLVSRYERGFFIKCVRWVVKEDEECVFIGKMIVILFFCFFYLFFIELVIFFFFVWVVFVWGVFYLIFGFIFYVF